MPILELGDQGSWNVGEVRMPGSRLFTVIFSMVPITTPTLMALLMFHLSFESSSLPWDQELLTQFTAYKMHLFVWWVCLYFSLSVRPCLRCLFTLASQSSDTPVLFLSSPYVSLILFHLCCCHNYCNKKQPREERVCLAYSSRLWLIISGKSSQDSAYHIHSQEQRDNKHMNPYFLACPGLVFSPFILILPRE